MKKMFPSLFRWMLFWIWFISVVWIGLLIVNASWDSTKSTATDSSNPSTNQKLTASEWNSMVSYVKWMQWMRQKKGTKIYYNRWNVWIWTSNPTTKLQVNWNIRASYPTQSYHVATKSYVDNATRFRRSSEREIKSSWTIRLWTYDFCSLSTVELNKNKNTFQCWVRRKYKDKERGWELWLNEHNASADCSAMCFNIW